jgi:tetratricopeptide (TPR) repeat protein
MTKTSLLIDKGAFSEAAELVDRLLIDLKGTKRANVLMRLHIDRAHIANYQGLTTLAIEHTRAARSIAAAFEPSVLLAYGLRYEARALSMAGEHSSAAKSIGEAFEMLRKMGKSEQSEVWQDMLRASGEVKARSGNWSEARKDLEEMLGTLRAFLPDNFRDQINTLDLLGAVSLAMGDAQFALTCHDEEIRLLNKHLSPDHPLRLRAELRVELAKTQMGNVSGKDKRIIELVQQLKSPLPEGSVHTKVLSEVGSSWGSASGKRQLALIF